MKTITTVSYTHLEVIDNTTSRGRTLRFLYDGPHDEFKKALYALGETCLLYTSRCV